MVHSPPLVTYLACAIPLQISRSSSLSPSSSSSSKTSTSPPPPEPPSTSMRRALLRRSLFGRPDKILFKVELVIPPGLISAHVRRISQPWRVVDDIPSTHLSLLVGPPAPVVVVELLHFWRQIRDQHDRVRDRRRVYRRRATLVVLFRGLSCRTRLGRSRLIPVIRKVNVREWKIVKVVFIFIFVLVFCVVSDGVIVVVV